MLFFSHLVSSRGESDFVPDIEAVGEAMGRHVDREFAQAWVRGRARDGATPHPRDSTESNRIIPAA
ncbi:hypothetical protein [Bradyrhizobium sp. CB1015]|uniref:hypothetical protein n=1 Tax=Bradyrhizobium sp. CB1015 TaxID=2976822 RepID=UPI0021AA884D|nr:hypothetical protein [Bradyrhizobium sp. CB1015]UWU96200.1 hypothetical protein N2604_30420 [Bradyrhizobium sp. CB1015]